MASLIWMSIFETKRCKLLLPFKIQACSSESKLTVLRWKVSLNAEWKPLYVVLDNILLLQPMLGLKWFAGSDAKSGRAKERLSKWRHYFRGGTTFNTSDYFLWVSIWDFHRPFHWVNSAARKCKCKIRTEHVSPKMRFLQPQTCKLTLLYNAVFKYFVAYVTNSGHGHKIRIVLLNSPLTSRDHINQ